MSKKQAAVVRSTRAFNADSESKYADGNFENSDREESRTKCAGLLR